MNKFATLVLVGLVLCLSAVPALAQAPAPAATGDAAHTVAAERTLINFSAAFGAGLVTLGAALGIGKLAASAVESMARQPEVAGDIRGAMIIAAALIEGFTFFALIICLIA